MSKGCETKAPVNWAGLMYCSQLLKCKAVTSQEQVAALAGIIIYLTFQIEYCIKNLLCALYTF